MVRRSAAAAALVLLAASGCGRALEEPTPASGEYLRGAFHLYLWCPELTPSWRALDLMYPANGPGSTWEVEEDGFDLDVRWAGVPVATGRRTSEGIDLAFSRLDAFGGEVDLTFRGTLRDDLRFHDRTIVGRIEGTYGECVVYPKSVAWMTVGPRSLTDVELDPQKLAGAAGGWSRFVWFLDIGPYGMHRKGDRGQRGRNLRLFSFATTGAGEIVTGDDVAFFDNGFGQYWEGAAEGAAATFEQPGDFWDLAYAQEILFDDGGGSSPGIHRVLSGFVGGRYRVSAENYPFGWEGETGMLAMNSPGLGFWLDLVRVPEPQAPASDAITAPPVSLHSEEVAAGDLRPLVLRVEDGRLAW